MPCRDYSDDYGSLENQRQRDRLARIACACMTKLHEMGVRTINEEADLWWKQHKIDDARAAQRKIEKAKEKKVEELKLLERLQAKYGVPK